MPNQKNKNKFCLACDRPASIKGYCLGHYQRLQKARMDPNSLAFHKPIVQYRGRRTGHINSSGYCILKIYDHALSTKTGVAEHRMVLYDKIGEGPHNCYWCGKQVFWRAENRSTQLFVDHLNDDKLNNNLNNLVPSCSGCNTSRSIRNAWALIKRGTAGATGPGENGTVTPQCMQDQATKNSLLTEKLSGAHVVITRATINR